jgi:hypothetical protein
LEQVVPVSITEKGFDPEIVTVMVSTIVEWTNDTDQVVRIVGGAVYRVYPASSSRWAPMRPSTNRGWRGVPSVPAPAGASLRR